MAAPLVGGALETGISYSVSRPCDPAPQPDLMYLGAQPHTARPGTEPCFALWETGVYGHAAAPGRARLPTSCSPVVARLTHFLKLDVPEHLSRLEAALQADLQNPDLGKVAVSAATAGFVLSSFLSPFELIKARCSAPWRTAEAAKHCGAQMAESEARPESAYTR